MTYLAIARAAFDGTRKTRKVPTGGENESARGYEINELNEKRSRGPVEASTPPAGWEGVAPADCGAPPACRTLGPCAHFTEHGQCWAERTEDDHGLYRAG